jgi:site-specific DNA-methyltransferase (adenine-specific)
LNEEQINAFRLADNKVGELATWDLDTLKVELDNIGEIDMSEFGFSLDGIGEEPQEVQEDDFDEEPPEEPISKLGDIYQLGEHRLMCGDSTDAEHVAKLMDGAKADLLLTDPPYGIDYGGMLKGKGNGHGGADKNGWKSYDAPSWDKKRPTESLFVELLRLSKNQIIWGGNYFADILPPKMCWLVWDKGQRDFSLADGELAWTSFDKALRIKTYSRALANREEKVHPTQKPIELLKWCIVDIAERNVGKIQTVFDAFGGSGSTLITCEQLNRKCYMMEMSPKYVDVIIKRWEEYTGKKAVKIA